MARATAYGIDPAMVTSGIFSDASTAVVALMEPTSVLAYIMQATLLARYKALILSCLVAPMARFSSKLASAANIITAPETSSAALMLDILSDKNSAASILVGNDTNAGMLPIYDALSMGRSISLSSTFGLWDPPLSNLALPWLVWRLKSESIPGTE
jgi:hypothetical protein